MSSPTEEGTPTESPPPPSSRAPVCKAAEAAEEDAASPADKEAAEANPLLAWEVGQGGGRGGGRGGGGDSLEKRAARTAGSADAKLEHTCGATGQRRAESGDETPNVERRGVGVKVTAIGRSVGEQGPSAAVTTEGHGWDSRGLRRASDAEEWASRRRRAVCGAVATAAREASLESGRSHLGTRGRRAGKERL
eukprot:g16170.t1